jgi:hypothetical protein
VTAPKSRKSIVTGKSKVQLSNLCLMVICHQIHSEVIVYLRFMKPGFMFENLRIRRLRRAVFRFINIRW